MKEFLFGHIICAVVHIQFERHGTDKEKLKTLAASYMFYVTLWRIERKAILKVQEHIFLEVYLQIFPMYNIY